MAKKAKKSKAKPKPKAAVAAAPAEPVNVMKDRFGTNFDAKLHAADANGSPHVDSMGKFILKEHHYDGAKKAHYGDSFRHA
jgi:hypothetical protein